MVCSPFILSILQTQLSLNDSAVWLSFTFFYRWVTDHTKKRTGNQVQNSFPNDIKKNKSSATSVFSHIHKEKTKCYLSFTHPLRKCLSPLTWRIPAFVTRLFCLRFQFHWSRIPQEREPVAGRGSRSFRLKRDGSERRRALVVNACNPPHTRSAVCYAAALWRTATHCEGGGQPACALRGLACALNSSKYAITVRLMLPHSSNFTSSMSFQY